MSKTKTSQTADRAGDLYEAARENPYVQHTVGAEIELGLAQSTRGPPTAPGRAPGEVSRRMYRRPVSSRATW